MKTFMNRSGVFLSAVLLFTGCAALSEFLKSAFQAPTFSFKRLGLDDLSLGGLTLDTVWALGNPNGVGISLASVDYALFIEEKQVVAGAPKQGLQIAPNASTELHFPANFKFQEVVAVVETFLNKDFAAYRAEGALGVQTPIGVIRLPIAKSGEFEVPKIPNLVFGNPKVSNLSLQGVTIEFPLTVINRNTFALPVSGVAGSLNLAGSNVGSLSTGNLGALEGKGTRVVSLPLTVNFVSAGMGLFNAVQKGSAQVQFNAKVQSGPLQVPLNIQQFVTFSK